MRPKLGIALVGVSLCLLSVPMPSSMSQRQTQSVSVIVIDVSGIPAQMLPLPGSIPVPKPLPVEPVIPRIPRLCVPVSGGDFVSFRTLKLSVAIPSWPMETAPLRGLTHTGQTSQQYPYDTLDPGLESRHVSQENTSAALCGAAFFFSIS